MMKKLGTLGLLLAALALLVVACGPATSVPDESAVLGYARNADGYADITAEQLADLVEKEEVTLVNVHVPYEGEMPDTDLFIAYDEISDHLDDLPAKDAPIVLYCRSGSMSTSAAQELAELGYNNVLEVDGGFNAWKAEGYELLQK